MIAVLRTIAVLDLVVNTAIFGLGWLGGLSPRQSLAAALIMLVVLGTVAGWRALVNMRPGYRPAPEQTWTHRNDPVAPPLALPQPAPRLLEAPGRELERLQ